MYFSVVNFAKINIAIDGYSACGKSTLAKRLAKSLNYIYIDSGAMYRAVTLYSIDNGIIKDDVILESNLSVALNEVDIEFHLNEKNEPEIFLNGINVEKKIRSFEVSRFVSQISSIKEVRRKLSVLQKKIGQKKGVVMDGRDIGTTIFPDAEVKFFLISDVDIRVQRRYDELIQKGEKVTKQWVQENLKQRDYMDTTREESPLTKSDDAIVIDNTNYSIEELEKIALEIITHKINTIKQQVLAN